MTDGFYLPRTLVIAHRGASDVAPENTFAAFQAALDAGADGIELDVTRCATGEIVVIHDDTVDRTTDGHGRVESIPYPALRALDAGSWFDPRFAGERVPLLGEVLERFGSELCINIEIKGRSQRGAGLVQEVAALVARHHVEKRVLLSSFNPWALERAAHVSPRLPRGLLYAGVVPFHVRLALRLPFLHPEALHPHHGLVDARYVTRAHERGIRVNVWTVDDPARMSEMLRLGVDGIITNHPAQLRALLPR